MVPWRDRQFLLISGSPLSAVNIAVRLPPRGERDTSCCPYRRPHAALPENALSDTKCAGILPRAPPGADLGRRSVEQVDRRHHDLRSTVGRRAIQLAVLGVVRGD